MNANSTTTLKNGNEGNSHKIDGGWRDIVAGGISGGITRLLIAPLDVIKIRFQVQTQPHLKGGAQSSRYHYSSISDSIKTIFRDEGLLVRFTQLPSIFLFTFSLRLLALFQIQGTDRKNWPGFFGPLRLFFPLDQAFWSGNLLAEYLYIAYIGAQFGSYAIIHDTLMKAVPKSQRESLAASVSFASGGAAAFVSITMTYPLDLLRTRFAAQSHPRTYYSVPQATQMIYRTDGLFGFYSGWGPTCLSVVPSMAVQFALYDWCKRTWFGGRETENPLVHAVAGALSGIVSKLAVLPLDVLKKRMQIQGLYHHRANGNAENATPYSSTEPHQTTTNGSTHQQTSSSQNSTQGQPHQNQHKQQAPAKHHKTSTSTSNGSNGGAAHVSAPAKRVSFKEAIRNIYRHEGLRGFFRGAVASALKAGISASLTFTFYEQARVLLLSLMRQID